MPFVLRAAATAGVLGSAMATSQPVDKCQMPAETGLCKAHMTKWFHNSQTSQCETFVYGGCGGNDNRFDSQAACQADCKPTDAPSAAPAGVPAVPVCDQPKVVGPCFAAMPKWFHNKDTHQCEAFIYGGCQGNQNNFASQEACQQQCPAPSATPTTATQAPVAPVPVCDQPKVVGPCRAAFPKWFHNKDTHQCEEFVYGGCQGNQNNFASQEACQQQCPAPSATPTTATQAPVAPVPVCEQAKVVGRCRAAMPRWWHNAVSGQCEEFIYGGCDANQNNFLTQAECQGQCPPPVPVSQAPAVALPVCEQPAETGPCRAAMTMWYHDAAADRCKTFTYGGCGGNDNMFNTRRACKKACTRDECALPADVGPCRAAMPKFFFNKDTRQCESFIYGGCDGNENRFDTMNQCENRCGASLLAAGRPAEAEEKKSGMGAGAVAGIGGAGGALVAALVGACMFVAGKRRSEEEPSVAESMEQLKASTDV